MDGMADVVFCPILIFIALSKCLMMCHINTVRGASGNTCTESGRCWANYNNKIKKLVFLPGLKKDGTTYNWIVRLIHHNLHLSVSF